MGRYAAGDVLLVPVALDGGGVPKTRPVVVVRAIDPGRLLVCPVSSKPPSDAPAIPLAIHDFSSGGLDLFDESYIVISRVLAVRSSAVIGKKGRLSPEALALLTSRVAGPDAGNGSGRHHR